VKNKSATLLYIEGEEGICGVGFPVGATCTTTATLNLIAATVRARCLGDISVSVTNVATLGGVVKVCGSCFGIYTC